MLFINLFNNRNVVLSWGDFQTQEDSADDVILSEVSYLRRYQASYVKRTLNKEVVSDILDASIWNRKKTTSTSMKYCRPHITYKAANRMPKTKD